MSFKSVLKFFVYYLMPFIVAIFIFGWLWVSLCTGFKIHHTSFALIFLALCTLNLFFMRILDKYLELTKDTHSKLYMARRRLMDNKQLMSKEAYQRALMELEKRYSKLEDPDNGRV